MSRKKYAHVQMLLPEIEGMIAAGKTPREAEAYFSLRDMYVGKSSSTARDAKQTGSLAK